MACYLIAAEQGEFVDVRGAFFGRIARHFRQRRMTAFVEAVSLTEASRVLDIGGSNVIWQSSPVVPQVTFLNLAASGDTQTVVGDARDMDFADKSFDIAFSNSVIEHVGTPEDQARFAAEVRRVAGAYWVQTPNRRFPLEPHYAGLFVHWLPRKVQRRVVRWTSLWGWTARPSQAAVDAHVDEIRLLSREEMRRLFPDAELIGEKSLFMTKSWIACRRA